MVLKLLKVFAPLVLSTFLNQFRKSQSEKNSVEVDSLRKESVDTQADFNTQIEEKLALSQIGSLIEKRRNQACGRSSKTG